eukprot:m.150646 g.150646  ORF g.150646 m.150646 type:complete len:187 (+) comp16882_c1_seq2:50-610(+)
MDDPKMYHGLLTGICKRLYFGDNTYTNEYLKKELYPNLPLADFTAMAKTAEKLITSVVSSDLDFSKLERFLSAQMTKKSEGSPQTEEQAKVFAKFWKTQRSKVQDQLAEDSIWQNRLASASWRIDLKTKAQRIEEMNEPVGIVELRVEEAATNATSNVQFEVDKAQLQNILQQVNLIEEQIKSMSA